MSHEVWISLFPDDSVRIRYTGSLAESPPGAETRLYLDAVDGPDHVRLRLTDHIVSDDLRSICHFEFRMRTRQALPLGALTWVQYVGQGTGRPLFRFVNLNGDVQLLRQEFRRLRDTRKRARAVEPEQKGGVS